MNLESHYVVRLKGLKKTTALTFQRHSQSTVGRSSHSIISSTAVCSTVTSVYVGQLKLCYGVILKDVTVGAILPHSGPGYVWCWVSSHITEQSHTGTFTTCLTPTVACYFSFLCIMRNLIVIQIRLLGVLYIVPLSAFNNVN